MIINGKPGSLRPAARADRSRHRHRDGCADHPAGDPALQPQCRTPTARSAKAAKTYRAYYALCLETEGYLDAVNQPQFPSSHEVGPGKPMHEVAVFRFGIVK